MKKVVVATVKPFAPVAVKGIREIVENAGYELIVLEKYADKQELIDVVKEADALIIRSDIIDKEVIEAASNLKIVIRAGAGYDNIDLDAATANQVVAMNTPGQNANAVAELAMGMAVYIVRNCFNGTAGTELRNKTIGLHAYGNVGKLVAEIAKGFGMEVHAFDPFIDKSIIENDGVIYEKTAEDLYAKCQFVSLHIPANDQTKESVNYGLLSKMPKGAVLINTARKEVICEKSLAKIFEERDDFRYATDIAASSHDTLMGNNEGRYYATPKKMGAQTGEANVNAGLAAARQIIGYFENGDTTYQVNN